MEILKRELVPAMGCTEPIAIAYCAAKAREALGALPDKITVAASGNIIKNVKSVIVPNTEGRKGIEAATAIGVLAGDANAELEVIARVKPEYKAQLSQYMETTDIQVEAAQSEHVLDIIVTVSKGTDTAQVQVVNEHTNIVKICKNDQIILEKEKAAQINKKLTVLTWTQLRRALKRREGKSVRTIAEEEGTSVNAVEESLLQARKKLEKSRELF